MIYETTGKTESIFTSEAVRLKNFLCAATGSTDTARNSNIAKRFLVVFVINYLQLNSSTLRSSR